MVSLTPDLLDHSREVASSLNVRPEIHDQDLIFEFVYNHPCFPTKNDAINYYLNDGKKSAEQLATLLANTLGLDIHKKLSLLEFASGYGCVTRHLKNELPYVDATSCDIHPQATDFIQHVLGQRSVLSTTRPEDLDLGEKFDVVFALSFFSHMPDRTWGKWIKSLYSHLKVGGALVFTTHGTESAKFFPDAVLNDSGYWFKSESEQSDLSTTDYGQTIVTPEYVARTCLEHVDAPIAQSKLGFWWEHQDLYVLRRN